MPIYEYRCGSGHVTELIRPVSSTSQRCSCGRVATRNSVYRTAISRPEERFAGRDFLEASAEIEDKRASLERREGVPVKAPDFYKQAVEKVKRITA